MLKTEAINLINPIIEKLKALKNRLSDDGLQELIKSFEGEPERLINILKTEKEEDIWKLRELELIMNSDIIPEINNTGDELKGNLETLIKSTCEEINKYSDKYRIVIETAKEKLEKALNPINIETLAIELISSSPVFSAVLGYIAKTDRIEPDNNGCYLISLYDMAQIGITGERAIQKLFKEVFLNDRQIEKHSDEKFEGYKLTTSR